MQRFVILRLLFLVAFAWSTTSQRCAANEPAVTNEDAIATQIKVLNEGTAIERRAAAEKLFEFGKAAVEPLANEAAEGKGASMQHCYDVLGRLLASQNAEISAEAQKALEKLIESKNAAVALRAKTVIRLKAVFAQREAARQAFAAAQPVAAQKPLKFQTNENGKAIKLEQAADGSFSGQIVETVNGEEKSTDFKAADAKELQEKFPDAHKALEKALDEQRRNARNAAPAAQPQFGGGLRANVQINGIGNQNVQVKIVNGDRTIQIRNGDEQVEIRDRNGKDIAVKHTRPIEGKAKTDEYKGADLDDLKKKHPDGAKLYEKYAAGNAIPGNVVPQIQIQAANGAFRVGNPVGSSSPGPRTIRADFDDRKVEIVDEDGRQIRVRITKTADGKETTEEFSADDLKQLRDEHPEAARLYEKLTGTSPE